MLRADSTGRYGRLMVWVAKGIGRYGGPRRACARADAGLYKSELLMGCGVTGAHA